MQLPFFWGLGKKEEIKQKGIQKGNTKLSFDYEYRAEVKRETTRKKPTLILNNINADSQGLDF